MGERRRGIFLSGKQKSTVKNRNAPLFVGNVLDEKTAAVTLTVGPKSETRDFNACSLIDAF
jgi:hypothetical protein